MADQKKILIVDDDPAFLDMMESKLFFANYQVLRATDGEEAFKLAIEESPHLIILDIRMPHADGFQVSVQLKKSDRTKDIPVFFLSALQNDEDQEAMLNEPARSNMIFAKSLPTQELITKIRQVLGES